MRNLNNFLFFLILQSLYLCSTFATHWDIEYWQYFNWTQIEKGPYTLYAVGELRLDQHMSHFYYSRITENFAYKAAPWLDLEAHYSYIYSKSPGAIQFTSKNRLEFEVSPSLTLHNGVILNWRSRIELLKRQQVSQIQFVYRERFMVIFPIDPKGPITSIYAYDEIHYDFDHNLFSQNRFVPIAISCDINADLSLNLFFMVRNFFSFSTSLWHRSIVFGSELQF